LQELNQIYSAEKTAYIRRIDEDSRILIDNSYHTYKENLEKGILPRKRAEKPAVPVKKEAPVESSERVEDMQDQLQQVKEAVEEERKQQAEQERDDTLDDVVAEATAAQPLTIPRNIGTYESQESMDRPWVERWYERNQTHSSEDDDDLNWSDDDIGYDAYSDDERDQLPDTKDWKRVMAHRDAEREDWRKRDEEEAEARKKALEADPAAKDKQGSGIQNAISDLAGKAMAVPNPIVQGIAGAVQLGIAAKAAWFDNKIVTPGFVKGTAFEPCFDLAKSIYEDDSAKRGNDYYDFLNGYRDKQDEAWRRHHIKEFHRRNRRSRHRR
jgi:hypothetical protein